MALITERRKDALIKNRVVKNRKYFPSFQLSAFLNFRCDSKCAGIMRVKRFELTSRRFDKEIRIEISKLHTYVSTSIRSEVE